MDTGSVRSLSRRVAIGVLFLVACCTLSAFLAKRATHFRSSTVIQRLGVLVLLFGKLPLSLDGRRGVGLTTILGTSSQ
jgi:hypothetical protein